MTRKSDATKPARGVSRRRFVRTAAAGAAAAMTAGSIPTKVFAQTKKSITFTLSWIPNGGSTFVNVADAKGFFTKRGIDVKVSRGFGSVASAQAIAQGKYDFGISAAPTSYLQVVKGMKLAHLACCSYSPAMGVGFLRSSGIAKPKDLEGRKMGSVVASGEFPFLPAFGERAGFDFSKVKVVQVDNKIRTGVLLSKQVDCISCFAASVAPDVKTRGFDVGWFLYDNFGMPFYGYMLITQPTMLARDKGLCEAVAEALTEGVMYTMMHPEEALDIFIKQVPEAGLTKAKRETLAIELGLFAHINLKPEAIARGMGSIDMANYKSMAELIMKAEAKPGDVAPALDSMLHLDLIEGKFKFSPAELAKVEAYARGFAGVLA